MYLDAFAVLLLILSSLIAPVEPKRTANSPKYLFSSESNILDDIPEGAFVVSQDQQEHPGSSTGKENGGYSRFRRSGPSPSTPAPLVTSSQELCPHEELLIRWTEDEGFTSNGSIVALCRKSKDGVDRQPLIFVSYDRGLSWNNVTEKFVTDKGKTLWLETYYNVPKKPNFFIFSDKKNKRIYYTHDGLLTLMYVAVPAFSPDEISINPENPSYVIAVDLKANRIHLSKDGSKTYNIVRHFDEINAYYWGSTAYGDKETDIFIEGKAGGQTKTQGYKVNCRLGGSCSSPQSLTNDAPLNGEVVDFLVKNEYMFCTKLAAGSTNVELYVKYQRTGKFVKAKIQTNSPLKELFVYDVSEGLVMLVANHRKNETNLYMSLDKTGTTYSLSLPRVLYHNPHTEVSSHWLRRAVVYRFVDIRKVNGLPSVYFATQLTVGPVGGRYLLSVVTFDKGGVWRRVRGPRRNKYGQLCFYPGCSLHVNLFYGSIYVHSRTVPLMSRKSAPGLIMTTGVLGSNLKITPDTYLSRDGGKSFKPVLSGKRRFAFGDHGGFVVASQFTTSRYLQYSYDFKTFPHVALHTLTVDIKQIVTEPGEKGVVFLVLGTINKVWRIFQINATQTLGSPCTAKDFTTVNVSDIGVGGCQIEQIVIRNISSLCRTGKNYTRVTVKSYEKCYCRKADYRCAYNFEATLDEGCRQKAGTSLVPVNCPENTFYFKSRGYSRIEGHNCQEDNTTRNNYSPVKTPCPVQKLSRLSIRTTPALKGKMVPVVLGQKLTVQLSLSGYLPHVEFTWTLNGSIVLKGKGKTFSTYTQTMNKIGYKELGMKVSNLMTTIYRTIYITTQRKLNKDKMKLLVIPTLPSVKQRVRFVLEFFNGSKPSDMGVLSYIWKVETFVPSPKTLLNALTSTPVLPVTFSTVGSKNVKVVVHNDVSTAEKSLLIRVTKDLKVKNVRLSLSKGNMLVRWDAVGEPSYVVVRYRVMYRKASNALFGEADDCARLALECVVTNISHYTTYEVKVDTVTNAGIGPPSDTQSIMTPMGKPSVPKNVKFSVAGLTKVEASWLPPKLPNGVLIGYTYKFYKKVKDARPADINNTTTIKVFDKLQQDEDYHFEIAARNKDFVGDFSEAISVRTGFDTPTLPPTNIIVRKKTTTTVELSWTPPKVTKDSPYLFSPKGYYIYSVKDGKQSKVFSAPDPRFTFIGLAPFTNYTFAIAAYVTNDKGPEKVGPTASTTFRTLMGPPLAPSEFKTTAHSSSSASFSWKPQGNVGLIENYEIYQRSPPIESPLVTVTKTQATVKYLTPFTKYTFAVRATNTHFKSPFSNNISFITSEDKPGPPEEVVVTDDGMWPQSSSVRVTWKPPTNRNGAITKYTVKWYIVDNNKQKQQSVKANSLSLEINHLRQDTKYGCDVVAFTRKGASTASSTLFTTHSYPYGSQHIFIEFEEPNTAAKLAKQDNFDDKFIQKVVSLTNIRKERIADVNLNTKDNSVNFELISKKELHGEIGSKILDEMDKIKVMLAPSFEVANVRTKENSLRSSQPRSGQQSSKKTAASLNIGVIAGVACACAVIIIILIAALVLLFRKYRQKSLYNKFDNQFQYNHDDDTVRSMNSDDGVGFHQPSYKHRNKDIETVPLADAEELT